MTELEDTIRKMAHFDAEKLVVKLCELSTVDLSDPDPSEGGACLTNDEKDSLLSMMYEEVVKMIEIYLRELEKGLDGALNNLK